ncbi:O-acyltransferase like protein [Diorhabda sublineata]|uniref:O-acyltransferase like protein n=1 Tax=Diorhabda sublineata TaxID=1163346 RepID=UPI0024E16EE8|nr:O-acyltransferase like protein [Diorhabda sublineata]
MNLLLAIVLAGCFLLTNNSENQSYRFQNIFKNITNFSVVKTNVNNDLNFGVNSSSQDNYEERGRLCVKNLTKCMEQDSEHFATSNSLGSFLFSRLPPFDLSNFEEISPQCRKQSKQFIQGLRNFQIWALKMYDSTAKLPSGILNGNINQFGDFDMCLDAFSQKHGIQGQYCLASIEVENPKSSYLAGLYQLIHSHNHFKSKLEDPGHRVPRFSSINWALCVPDSCTAKDVELGLKKTVQNILNGTEFEIRYEVDPSMCQKKTVVKYPTSLYITIAIFGFIIVWECVATLYDILSFGEKDKWIMAFSLKNNFLSSITLTRPPGDIEAVHGIRCLNALFLLASHKSMAAFFQPAPNRTAYVEFISRPFSVIGRAASLYTDPFIMISGMLTTYSLLGRLQKTQKINIIEEYTTRLFRILPTFMALIAFCTFILPHIDSGPLWNLVVTHHSDICKKYWWRNLLFIHNYFGFKDMCLTHTHHLGIDTQLFFVSPLLIYLIWRWPKRGSIILIALAAISTIMRYYVSYTMRLSNYVHFGTSIQQLFDTADHMYILPAHRATVYIMGIFLGYILRNFSNLSFTKTQLNVGNTMALFTFFVSFFGAAFMGTIDYVYDPKDAAWYAAVSPILWCFSFAWVIFIWQLGYKIAAGYLFSHKLFLLWTKISYTVYLTQFPVFFYNVGTTRSSNETNFFWSILNLREYAWVIGLSILLSLTIEIPFQNIRHIYIGNKNMKKRSEDVEVTEEKVKSM